MRPKPAMELGHHPDTLRLAQLPLSRPLDAVEAHVKAILDSRKRHNASGQDGEDAEQIRAAYLHARNTPC